MVSCTGVFGGQCGEDECQLFSGESAKGICCPRRSTASFSADYKIGQCPTRAANGVSTTNCVNECTTDASCKEVNKCCKFGCSQVCASPVNATNCIHYKSAVERLIVANSVPPTMHKPICDDRSGLYGSTQCNSEGQCWCVDTVTGI
uniref:Uncharacterized protein n=1 Tax=Plectus sambesii TaxID=2011161 RepID=A0A914VH94_9BILA